MELLKAALFVTLLAVASTRPTDWRQHQDADIADTDWTPEWPNDNSRWASHSSESFSREDSTESSESRSSSSEESSEEVLLPDVTTTTETTGDDGSTLAPEPDTPGTDEPAGTTTAQPGRQTPATPACDQCFTVEIPTEAPITDNRGDN